MKVKVGDQIPEWVMERVAPERMRTMAAILRDPNPVHWDRSAVAALGFGFGERTINQGPLGVGYMLNMLHEWAGPTSIRRIVTRFPRAILDNDRITAKGVITGLREENGEVLADCDIWLEREPSDRPLEGTATVCIPD